MARCIDGHLLFRDDEDRDRFLSLLRIYVNKTECRCYAWALMPNHYHLLLRQGSNHLWQIMKPLNMRYAQYHGKKYGRRGPLFMDRYKSIITQDQNYIQELVRYIHLNPLRAGICPSLRALESYPWCGHGALAGRHHNKFQDTAAVLTRFGKRSAAARNAYRQFIQEGSNADNQELLRLVRSSNAGTEKGRESHRWVIGDPEFVRRVVHQSHAQRLRLQDVDQRRMLLEKTKVSVCRAWNVPPELLHIRHRGGSVSKARKAFSFICREKHGMPTSAIAHYLRISPGAASNLCREGRKFSEDIERLKI